MTNWKCQACGKVHTRNPSQCKNCGHTVFQQTEEKPPSLISRLKSMLGF